jgi:bifunctional polynucleotide phosphatase/kinase
MVDSRATQVGYAANTPVWLLISHAHCPTAADLKDSFFVGDAAGREGDAVGDSDLQFARTIGLPFKTPDEVFG